MTATAREGHIFLSHSGSDTQAADHLAEFLRHNGLEVWLDKDNLQPGDSWMTVLEQEIQKARAMIVYIGALGVQAWVDREIRLGLVRNTQDPTAFRLIPVLGEGAEPASLPPFLQQHQWIDLRDSSHAPKEMRRLVDVLRSSSEKRAISSEYWGNHSPFRGLQVFTPEDAWLFFGRDSETSELLSRLGRTPVLMMLGNSGCGKSSLIRAGLIPALRRGRFRSRDGLVESWKIVVFRPSNAPFDELAKSLLRNLASELSITQRGDFIQYCKEKLPFGGDALRNAIEITLPSNGTHVLLVADQFEEIFTLTNDAKVRQRYIEGLLRAAQLESDLPVHLVLGLRADFYAHCLDHQELICHLQTNLYNVPRMVPEQLQETIEKRLTMAEGCAEMGLIDSILSDVGTEPGNLALLEHALDQLWEKRTPNNMLTNEAYSEIGRLRGALHRHADEVYKNIHSHTEQRVTQKIFLELVQLGEGAQDTRRRVRKEALLHLGNPSQVVQLIANLTANRLLHTSGEGSDSFVEVSHEAIIREWSTLREWLAENREELRLERRLFESAEEWDRLKRDHGALLQGLRLVQAEEWLCKRPDVPGLVREFVEISTRIHEETTHRERIRVKRKFILSAGVAILVSVLITIGSIFVVQEAIKIKLDDIAESASLIDLQILRMVQERSSMVDPNLTKKTREEQTDKVIESLSKDSYLRSFLEETTSDSPYILDIAVTNRQGYAVLHSDITLEGKVPAVREAFVELKKSGFRQQLRVLYGPVRVYDVHLPFAQKGQICGDIRVGISSVLLKNAVQPLVTGVLILMGLSALICLGVAGGLFIWTSFL